MDDKGTQQQILDFYLQFFTFQLCKEEEGYFGYYSGYYRSCKRTMDGMGVIVIFGAVLRRGVEYNHDDDIAANTGKYGRILANTGEF